MTTVTGPDPENLGRVDQLRRVDAEVRGLSMEPLWEEVPPERLDLRGIDWVIAGGESGSGKFVRPFPVEWAERLRRHCQKEGVAFFLKQLGRRPTRGDTVIELSDTHGGDWEEWDGPLRTREFPAYFQMYRDAERPAVTRPRRPPKGGLTRGESDDFKRLRKVVERAARSFVDAAAALHEIRERKLYRGKFKRFEDYCQRVHQISRQYANKLIRAGKIRIEMETIVSKNELPAPSNEAQLRELGRLGDPVQREQVYIEAVEVSAGEGRPVTAGDIRAVAEKTGALAKSARPGRPAAMGVKDREVVRELLAKAVEDEDWSLVRRALDLVDPRVPSG